MRYCSKKFLGYVWNFHPTSEYQHERFIGISWDGRYVGLRFWWFQFWIRRY